MNKFWIILAFILGAVASFFATNAYFNSTKSDNEPGRPVPRVSIQSAGAEEVQPARVPAETKPSDVEAYKNALKEPLKIESCNKFLELSKKENFSLQKLASLRAALHCTSKETPSLANITESYLTPLKIEAEVKRTEKSGNVLEQIQALILYSTQMKSLSERVKVLLSAKDLALKNKLAKPLETVDQEIQKHAPRFRPTPTPEEFLEVGQDFIAARQFDQGREFLKKVFNNKTVPFERRRKAYQSFRNSFKTEQDKKTHLKEAQNYFDWLVAQKESKFAVDAGIYLARAYWTEGQQSKGENIFSVIEKKFKGKAKLEEINFLRGRMREEDGKYAEAVAFYDLSLKGAKNSPLGIKAGFGKAWSLMQLQKFKESAEEFGKTSEAAVEVPDQIKAKFWQARNLLKDGNTEGAENLLNQITVEDPLGFYGLLAYRDLKKEIPSIESLQKKAVKSGAADPETSSGQLKAQDRQLIQDLAFVGEREVLEAFLNQLSQEPNWQWDTKEGMEVLRAYGKAGLYMPLFSVLTKIPKEDREELLILHPELLFPLEYETLIKETAKTEGLPSELIFSIIRQESAFDPRARSVADAMGLMQVLPSAAENLSKDLKLKFSHHDDLYDPAFNIPVGAHLLKKNFTRYKDNFILAVAAYNANDRAIKNWLNTRFREDPVEFIEEIPYEETRAYVKLVMRNFIFYRRLGSPRLNLSFPSECLPSLQAFRLSTDKDVVSR
jgi:soluble lytic murein transglycosylase